MKRQPKKRHKPLAIKGLRVRLVGLEPTTYGLKVRCSNQLSYSP